MGKKTAFYRREKNPTIILTARTERYYRSKERYYRSSSQYYH